VAHFQVIHIASARTSSRIRVIAKPALGGAAGGTVLDPVAREHLLRPIIHLHREVHGEFTLRLPQPRAHLWRQAEPDLRPVKLLARVVPGIGCLIRYILVLDDR
jgi:hypothetical protein